MSEIPLTVTDVTTRSCGCGAERGEPVLDVRLIPHAIRHASVFGALTAIAPGDSMVILAPHNPKPLLAQIADRENGAIAVTYLVEGPEEWSLRFTRAA